MGHYRSEMGVGKEEQERSARFHEALDIQGRLNAVPASSFTFGDLNFLFDLYQFEYGHNVRPDQLEHLRAIAQKVGAA